MSFEPVPAWDMHSLLASESAVGTTPDPAAAQAVQQIDFDAGQSEVGEIRDVRDRSLGRGMRPNWVEGRKKPIPFSLETSVKGRTAATTVPQESTIFKAAGLTQTVGGGSVAYTTPASPVLVGSFASLSAYRFMGQSPYTLKAEQLRGGLIKTLNFSGGDKELVLKADGEALGRYALGYAPSITLADGSGTTLTFGSIEEGLRFGIGWYQVESEIIKITVPSTTASAAATIARAALGSTGAAHAAVPLRPYVPAMSYPAAAIPISEINFSAVIDGVTMRAMSFDFGITTGMEFGPGESGSQYPQTIKVIRYDATLSVKLLLHREDVALEGKASQRKTCATTIVCGTTAGSILTISCPYAELQPFKTPAAANDAAIVDLSLRLRDNSGNDMFSVTYT